MGSSSPRSSARETERNPPAKTGASSVLASEPSIGIKPSITVITTNRIVMAIHTQGFAANRRQPSLHHALPWPAGTAEGPRRGGTAPAPPSNPGVAGEGGGGAIGSFMGYPFVVDRSSIER